MIKALLVAAGIFVPTGAALADATTPPPAADPAPGPHDLNAAARQHYKRGSQLYDLEKYAEAIKEFEQGYEARPEPAFLFNIAQSHRLAGHTADAIRMYRAYLRSSPKAANRVDVEGRIADLEALLAKTPPPAAPPAAPPTAPPPAAPPAKSPGGTGK